MHTGVSDTQADKADRKRSYTPRSKALPSVLPLPGVSGGDNNTRGPVKGAERNHSGYSFREQPLLYCVWVTTCTVEAWLGLGSEGSHHQGLYVEEAQ